MDDTDLQRWCQLAKVILTSGDVLTGEGLYQSGFSRETELTEWQAVVHLVQHWLSTNRRSKNPVVVQFSP